MIYNNVNIQKIYNKRVQLRNVGSIAVQELYRWQRLLFVIAQTDRQTDRQTVRVNLFSELKKKQKNEEKDKILILLAHNLKRDCKVTV